MLLLAGSLTNAQTIKRSKQRTEQAIKPKQNNDSRKSSKTTLKSTKSDNKKSNSSTSSKGKATQKRGGINLDDKPSTKSSSSSASLSSQSMTPNTRPAEPTYDVTFSCNVKDANLYVDGRYWGYPRGTHPLKVGSYQVKIIANGYEEYTTTINVEPRKNAFDFKLTRIGTSGPYVPEFKSFSVKGVHFDMLFVEGGKFMMGATVEQGRDARANEHPIHEVALSNYYIGKCEVTQELWQAVMGGNPSYFTGNSQRPVEMVSWNDCQEFIKKLNSLTGKQFRLPTEAEWEYAARGGKESMGYRFAGSNNLDEVGWYYSNSAGTTHPVGLKSPNEFGLHDMSGNVYEWCQDWYSDYSREAQTNPSGPSLGSDRVWRGGCWGHGDDNCRSTVRNYYNPSGRYPYHGLRLAATSL